LMVDQIQASEVKSTPSRWDWEFATETLKNQRSAGSLVESSFAPSARGSLISSFFSRWVLSRNRLCSRGAHFSVIPTDIHSINHQKWTLLVLASRRRALFWIRCPRNSQRSSWKTLQMGSPLRDNLAKAHSEQFIGYDMNDSQLQCFLCFHKLMKTFHYSFLMD